MEKNALPCYTNVAPAYLSILDKPCRNKLDRINRNSKAETLCPPDDRRIDADYFSAGIDERTA